MTAGNRCCVCPGGDAVALSLQPLCEKKNRACIVVVCDKKNSLDPIYSAETIHIYKYKFYECTNRCNGAIDPIV